MTGGCSTPTQKSGSSADAPSKCLRTLAAMKDGDERLLVRVGIDSTDGCWNAPMRLGAFTRRREIRSRGSAAPRMKTTITEH